MLNKIINWNRKRATNITKYCIFQHILPQINTITFSKSKSLVLFKHMYPTKETIIICFFFKKKIIISYHKKRSQGSSNDN